MGKYRLVCQYGKGERLLRVAVKAKLFIRHHPARRQKLADMPHERFVHRAAPADDEPRGQFRREVAYRRGYTLRCEARCRCEHIQKRDAFSLGICAKERNVIRAVTFSARRFRRALRDVRVGHHTPQELFIHVPMCGKRAARIICRRAIRHACGDSVHDHVARPRVERKDIIQPASSGEKADISYPADVLQGNALGFTAVEQKFRIWHKRRTESARCHIPHAKVAHNRARERLCEHRALTQLERTVQLMAQIFLFKRYVPKGLTVVSNEVYVLRAHTGMAAELAPRIAIQLSKEKVHTAEVRRGGSAAAGEAKYLRADFRLERHKYEIALLHACRRAVTVYLGENGVDPIRTRAGHEADDETGRLIYKCQYRMHHRSPSSPLSAADINLKFITLNSICQATYKRRKNMDRILLGQRLGFGFEGTRIPDDFAALVREYKIGNVVLFRRNIENNSQLRQLCRDIQSLIIGETGHPAFITIDQEGGMVTRLAPDAVNVPGNMAVAATGRIEDAYTAAAITARQLRGVGVNFNLAPVLDVNSNSRNPVIGVRSYGDDAARVAALAREAVRGYAEAGVLCCGKHFPGHGDTAVDSHLGLPCIDKSLTELEETELLPFRAAIGSGIPAIMSSHILFPRIEPENIPATMSAAIMRGVLRGRLGFNGLTLSDCMVMDAIRAHYGTVNGVVAALCAGVDIVFVCSDIELQRASAEAVAAAAARGDFDNADMYESIARIFDAKAKYAFTDAKPELCGRPEDFAAARDISRRAITALDGAVSRADENTFFCGCADYRVTQAANDSTDALPFAEYMHRRFGGKYVTCSLDPDAVEITHIGEIADSCGSIIMSTCNAHIYEGQLKLARALAAAGHDMTVAALRNPYDLSQLPRGIHRVAAWDYTADSLAALAEVFSGGICGGVMPVRL